MAKDYGDNYLIYKVKGRPIFAVPVQPHQIRQVGLARYQPFTFKRTLYRHLMKWAIALHLDSLFYNTADSPIDNHPEFNFHLWLQHIRCELKNEQLQAVVFWPPQVERQRVYVHLIDTNMKAVGFAKIGFDKYNDLKIQRETQTLNTLYNQQLEKLHAPQVIAEGTFAEHKYLIVEPIPESARPISPQMASFPSQAVSEIAGTPYHIPADQITNLSWWNDYRTLLSPQSQYFDNQLQELLANGFTASRVHGDFSSGNIVCNDQKLWIFDWEESRQDGPVLSDEVGYFLAVNFVGTLADPISGLHRLDSQFLGDKNVQRRVDVMMALALRLTTGMQDAALLINNWKHLK